MFRGEAPRGERRAWDKGNDVAANQGTPGYNRTWADCVPVNTESLDFQPEEPRGNTVLPFQSLCVLSSLTAAEEAHPGLILCGG